MATALAVASAVESDASLLLLSTRHEAEKQPQPFTDR